MSRAPDTAPLPGTRPRGGESEAEAGQTVRTMFGRIATRYDLLNHLLSLSLDRIWRKRMSWRLAPILRRADAVVCDLCCGTGDLTFALAQVAGQSQPGALVLGSDFAEPMLVLAQQKARRRDIHTPVFEADAMTLPLADASVDLITSAFGFRNLVNYRGGLAEFFRVLRPEGELGILEFAEPRRGALAGIYRTYFSRVLPRIGGAVSGNAKAYSYLAASVAKFPQPEELLQWIRDVGYVDVTAELWMSGAVVLYRGKKPR